MSRQSRNDGLGAARGIINGVLIELAVVLLILLGCKVCHSESLPDTPSPAAKDSPILLALGIKPIPKPFMTKTEAADLAAVGVSNFYDWYTTERFLKLGGKEGQLPTAVVSNSKGFFAFKSAETIGIGAGQHWLDRTKYAERHRWFPYATEAGMLLISALTARTDVNNWQYGDHIRKPVTAFHIVGGAR